MSVERTNLSNSSNAIVSGFMRLVADPMGAIGVVLVTLLILSAVFAGVLAPFDPAAINVPAKLQPPTWTHWLGTDQLGRDVLSRALYGGRIALGVALISTILAVSIGVVLGMIAGFGPRWLDNLLVLLFDTVRAYPVIILALAVGPIFGAGLTTVIGILVVTSVPYYGRIVRTSVISASKADYVEALMAMGMSRTRIVVRHVLPNIIGPILILASMDIPVYIAAEAGLSFLGVGVKPPQSSWGLILDDGYKFIRQTYWLVIAGSVPLIAATLGFTFLGEALRDTFDPKLRKGV
ncbi:Glutathione transport system permease protein GsiD [Roseovarius albus]|uniref:Glutathione transport system permease protein GsiD n=1 Tax=Roseovarius albus TaxID=1247867 RepID=A0A1X6ZLU8_9RHOB|nr:ABC transporter permease [Roseovarius albus]SLN54861.1 Glutathione transport system permease protein GsiD [Roseovarius albus]